MPETVDTRYREMPAEPGLYPDVVSPHYHSWRACSQSFLKLMDSKTPYHAHRDREQPDEPGKDGRKLTVQEIGTAVHALVLQPSLFEGLYVPRPPGSGNSNAYKAAAERIKAENPWSRITKVEDLDLVKRIRDAIMEHPVVGPMIESVERTEISALWDDPDTGIRCKGRFDLPVPGVGLGDLKITHDASEEGFGKTGWNFRYDIQAAHYLTGASALGMDLPPDFFLVAVERDDPAPEKIATYELPGNTLVAAETQLDDWMERYAECVHEGRWPGYPEDPQPLYFPTWGQKHVERVLEMERVA